MGEKSVYQMLWHVTFWESWISGRGNPVYKQAFIGKLFGKMVLKSITKDDSPLKRNTPSGSAFQTDVRTGDIELTKRKWIDFIKTYPSYSNPSFIHDFFGIMTREQIGILSYKHTDHHLRQFNC